MNEQCLTCRWFCNHCEDHKDIITSFKTAGVSVSCECDCVTQNLKLQVLKTCAGYDRDWIKTEMQQQDLGL